MPILAAETSIFPADLLDRQMPVEDRQWWVAHTKPRQEKSLARDLLSMELGFYLPLIQQISRIGRRRVKSHLPMFAGYVFMFVSEEERQASLATKRIAQFLPVCQLQELTQDLRNIRELIESGVPLSPEGRLQPGRRVRVKWGSLRGLEGVVVERRGESRLLVAVHFLEQGVSVQIDDDQVEPL